MSCLIEQPLVINRSDARSNVNLALTKSAIKDYNLDSLACYIPLGDTMTQTWQLQEAKNKLSKVVDDALSQGPQIITRRGVEVVIVIAYEQFKKMNVSEQKLSDFFRSSPLVGEDLDLTRDKSAARDDLTLAEAMWECVMTLDMPRTGLSAGIGSGSNTSIAAPAR